MQKDELCSFILIGVFPLIIGPIFSIFKEKFGSEVYEKSWNKLFNAIILNSISPFISSIDITLIMKLCNRAIMNIRLKKSKNSYSQQQLNKQFENPKLNMLPKYAYIQQVVMLSFVFFQFSPLVTFFCFIGLAFQYCLELVKFTHLYSKPDYHSSTLAFESMKYFNFYFIVGYLLSDYFFFWDSLNIWIEIPIILVLLTSFIWSYKGLFDKYFLFFDPQIDDDCDYKIQYLKCKANYENINPSFHRVSISKYFNHLVDLKLISDEQLKIILEEQADLALDPSKLYAKILDLPHFENTFGLPIDYSNAIRLTWLGQSHEESERTNSFEKNCNC